MKEVIGVGKYLHRIRIQKPEIQSAEDVARWRELQKYVRLIPSEPEPNMGRVLEIKEEIARGIYLTPDKIEETAARLAIRFMRPE